MEDEVINLLYDVRRAPGNPDQKRYVERNEEKTALMGQFHTTIETWHRLGEPTTVNVQIRRVL